LHRKQAAYRKSLHGQMVHRVLGMGAVIQTEKLSYRALQQRFGRSVGMRAPGAFVAHLKRKAESASAGDRVLHAHHPTEPSLPPVREGGTQTTLPALAQLQLWCGGSTGFVFCLPRAVRGRGTTQRGPRTSAMARCGHAPPGGVEPN
jgi:hypothetical protein